MSNFKKEGGGLLFLSSHTRLAPSQKRRNWKESPIEVESSMDTENQFNLAQLRKRTSEHVLRQKNNGSGPVYILLGSKEPCASMQTHIHPPPTPPPFLGMPLSWNQNLIWNGTEVQVQGPSLKLRI